MKRRSPPTKGSGAAYAEFDRRLDWLVAAPFDAACAPAVLYHYTSWAAAENILRTRCFRATSHRTSDDRLEARSADAIVRDVVEALRSTSSEVAMKALGPFGERYPFTSVANLFVVCISCFSATADSSLHWEKYGAGGDGVCLGIRILREVGPGGGRGRTPGFMAAVDYSKESLLEKILVGFREILATFEAYVRGDCLERDRDRAVRATANALSRFVAFANVSSKTRRWDGEAEWGLTTICLKESFQPRVHYARGVRREYIELPARASNAPIELADFLVGPANGTDAERRATEMLSRLGYGSPDLLMPTMVKSSR